MSLASYFQTASAAGNRTGGLARFTDIALVAGIVAIIALMIVPLPTWAIDVLVAVNIAGGVLLLLLAIYVANPLEFSVFPSVLLISTLFRLALSIATTRMILLHGEAGHIIQTFGHMVAGGNLVVGLVVFLIITVVQFIVIAKGSERVAEVAARFSLDAMPGKQMSIDSDLRSGLIDKDEARRRRRVLENESKLNGSLDGAMKFVKGDAIAGIIIIIINLLGGLAIGVLQLDMAMGDAAVKYSILTIGDGMVTQIPALLGAMSAGLLVTRTTDDEHDKHLGDAIGRQLTAKPRVLLVAGGLCLLFAMVPGFPVVVFVLLGVALFTSGAMLTPALRARWERFAQPKVTAVRRRAADLKITDIYQNVGKKAAFLRDFMAENGYARDDVAYCGDDLNDLAAMALCGFVACPADAAPEVRARADYICPQRGGEGAVRGAVEKILRGDGRWNDAVKKAFQVEL